MSSSRNRNISNVQIMQLFHEIKQQFPSVSDQVITSCISSQIFSKAKDCSAVQNIPDIIGSLVRLDEDLMGHKSHSELSIDESTTCSPQIESHTDNSNVNMGDDCHRNSQDQNPNSDIEDTCLKSNSKSEASDKLSSADSTVHKRPTNLVTRPTSFPKSLVDNYCGKNNNFLKASNFKLSPTPCQKNVENSDFISPDISIESPSTPPIKKVEEIANPNKKETVETPTQTTSTLLGDSGVNISVNLNYSMDYLPKNSQKYMSQAEVTPFQPWLLQPSPQKNYTSVNLTLRPPSSTPQSPIDITSENARLTYSTSSFDSQKGLESRLQITVGPSGSCVASSRIRPRSCYLASEKDDAVMIKAGSLPNLTMKNDSVISRQQVRIERLRIELSTEKAKLVIIRRDVSQLENNNRQITTLQPHRELEEQLKLEIKHLRYQCEQLASETHKLNARWRQEQFYQNIYTGQRGPLNLAISVLPQQQYGNSRLLGIDSSKWHCHLCTFLNHPDLNKCEQCDMARIVQELLNHQIAVKPSNENIIEPFKSRSSRTSVENLLS